MTHHELYQKTLRQLTDAGYGAVEADIIAKDYADELTASAAMMARIGGGLAEPVFEPGAASVA